MSSEELIEHPLVSVGIPCYNRPSGLRKTLECICGQTYKNIEIIVSDNGSPNFEVQSIGYEFAYKDSRVSYYRQPRDMGGLYNVKFVLKNSRGKYFMFAADDDEWEPEYIELLLKEHRSHENVLLAAGGVTLFDSFRNEIYPRSIPGWVNHSRFHAMFFIIASHHWAYTKANMVYGLYKKDFVENLKLYEGCSSDVGNDVLTLMRVLSKGDIKYVPKNIMRKGSVEIEKNMLGHFHILGPARYILNKMEIKKYPQHDGIDEFTKSASDIISDSGFTMTQEIILRVFNQISRIRLMVLF